MKYLVASDIHGRKSRAEELEKRISEYNPDKIILLGDFLYNGPRNGVPEDYDGAKVSEILNKYKDIIIAVEGNCDARIDHMMLNFEFPRLNELMIDGHKAYAIHGDELELVENKLAPGDILMFGHTHVYAAELNHGVYFLNPGSISFPKVHKDATFMTITNDLVEIKELFSGKTLLSTKLS